MMFRLTSHVSRLTSAALALCLLLPLPAAAETYRVDLIVFLDLAPAGESGGRALAPDLRGALEPGSAGTLKASGIEVLPDEQFGLVEQWQRLRNSKRFRPVARLAWLQADPPGERGPSLRIKSGASITATDVDGISASALSEIDGSVALLLGRYLHVDADLIYTQAGADGARSWRLDERRRMKRDEVHHLDSPKLGILAKVSKAATP